MEEEDLQEEPLQVRMMDHDTYSAHNAIGKVYISLSSLANDRSHYNSGTLDGWFPIYDTLHGIRGEVRLIVEVELLKDQHRFRQSSCGIMFFTCPQTPSCYSIQAIHGFLEELVVNDDPEYKWIDRIRTPRASNEARQRLFSRLTGELQRKIGLKTIEVGGNAVVGYQQYFDLEGDTGIVVRGIGTCISLVPKRHSIVPPIRLPHNIQVGVVDARLGDVVSPKHARLGFRKTSSSDSDGPSSPTKGGGGSGSNSIIIPPFPAMDGNISTVAIGNSIPPQITASSSEFPFYTLTSLPPGLLRHIGGVVSSHSVKLLDKIEDPEEPEKRDTWWYEVRNEVRSHSQAMGCNAVIGYSESTTICDTLCIFSAIGTAVCISTHLTPPKKQTSPGSSVEEVKTSEEGKETSGTPYLHCGVCHIPYSHNKPPSKGRLSNCSICNSNLVPSIILSTAEPSLGVAIRGYGTLLQVRVVLPKRRLKGEENAIFISKQLPYLEYTLYNRLLHKVKLKGMNAVFSLQIQYTVGDTMIIMVATGTGVYLEALPPPSKLVISEKESARLLTLQEALNRSQKENVALYNLKHPLDIVRGNRASEVLEDEMAPEDLNQSTGRLETYTFEVEDSLKEEDITELILDSPLPKGFYAANSHLVPGISSPSISSDCRMITIVTKKNLEPGKQHIEKQCAQFLDSVHQALAFKVRKISPCLLTRIHYHIDLPEDDILQIAVTAMVTRMRSSSVHKSQSDEMIFAMEEAPSGVPSSAQDDPSSEKNTTDAGSVHITPLPSMCESYVERYIKIINFFVIRESTSIRESGGLDSFMHLFTLESLAIARAHVAAVGGNALLNFRMNDCVLIEHPHKNQAQCLLNVSGDAAVVCPSSSATATATATATISTAQTAAPSNLSYPGSMETQPAGTQSLEGKDVHESKDQKPSHHRTAKIT